MSLTKIDDQILGITERGYFTKNLNSTWRVNDICLPCENLEYYVLKMWSAE